MSLPFVLVADNDPAVSGLLVEVLARKRLRVTTASDGEIACAMLREGSVDLLVCDLDMPKMGGLEVLEWLGRNGEPPPAVVISGFVDEAIERRLAALPHVRVVLRKPFDLFAFGDLVVGLLAGESGGGGAAESEEP